MCDMTTVQSKPDAKINISVLLCFSLNLSVKCNDTITQYYSKLNLN